MRSATSPRIWSIARDRLGLDLLACLLQPALPLDLRLVLRTLNLRIGNLPGLRQDLGRLRARLGQDGPVLLQQVTRLVASVVGFLDRLANPVATRVDRLLDRAERELPEHEERDPERDQRPDHEAGDDLDQVVARLGCENVQHRAQTRT